MKIKLNLENLKKTKNDWADEVIKASREGFIDCEYIRKLAIFSEKETGGSYYLLPIYIDAGFAKENLKEEEFFRWDEQ